LPASPANIVFSPYSIGTAMAMALSGARGDTAPEMSRVLQHRLPVAGIEAANGEAMAILNGYDHSADTWTCPPSMTAKGHQCETPPIGGARPCNATMRLEEDRCVGNATPPRFAKLLTANALMLSKRGDAVSDAYTTLLRARYAADIFKGAGLADINAWVARKTEGKIDKILDTLSDDTAAILLNAVYFKAHWAVAFNPSLTKNDVFNLSGAQKVQVPMMRRGDNLTLFRSSGSWWHCRTTSTASATSRAALTTPRLQTCFKRCGRRRRASASILRCGASARDTMPTSCPRSSWRG
jgi:serpin B